MASAASSAMSPKIIAATADSPASTASPAPMAPAMERPVMVAPRSTGDEVEAGKRQEEDDREMHKHGVDVRESDHR